MKASIFLLEGADGVGKTTVAGRLAQQFVDAGQPEPRFIHNGAEDSKLPGSLYRHYRAQLLDAVDFRDQGISTIIDRSYLSELVYGNLYRGASRISLQQAHALDAAATELDVILLGLSVPDELRRQRIEARGESWDAQQPFVAETYRYYFQERNGFWIIADS